MRHTCMTAKSLSRTKLFVDEKATSLGQDLYGLGRKWYRCEI